MPQDVADFQGRLSFETRLSAVLERVIELHMSGVSILRLTDRASNRTGDIAIMNGKYVCGAVLQEYSSKTDLCKGYDALRALCGSASADFLYLTNAPNFMEDLTLNIELVAIVKLVPELPEDRNLLQNDEFALNRIFGTLSNVECVPVVPINPTAASVPSGPRSSHDGWITAVSPSGATVRAETEHQSFADMTGNGSPIIEEEQVSRPSLQERANQEFGEATTAPAAPVQSQAQKMLRKPAFFAVNVLTATAQMWKGLSIAMLVLFAIGGSIYLGNKVFQTTHSLAQHPSPPAPVRTPATLVRHVTRVSAVRRPAAPMTQNASYQQQRVSSSAAPAGVSAIETPPHRRAYQTYP